jgi:prepilin-type N-terminal cleavage/methylation domain-containing protein
MVTQAQQQRGFTLIELLVVITIIALLTGLLLVGARLLREDAQTLSTRSRIQEVQGRIVACRAEGSGLVDAALHRLTGTDRQWVTLRACLGRLVNEHGLALDRPADLTRLPPNLGSISDPDIGTYRSGSTWLEMRQDPRDGIEWEGRVRTDLQLDNVIVWSNKRDFTQDVGFFTAMNGGSGPSIGTPRYEHWVNNVGNVRTYVWWRRTKRPTLGDPRWSWTYQTGSPLGESLNKTAELDPDAQHPTDWYLRTWPILSETRSGADFVQRAWPDSDWDQATPGLLPPCWEAPFGRGMICRKDGAVLEQHLLREAGGQDATLADFTPLATPFLLERIGTLPPNSAEAYRQDRNPARAWNDAWGNPLLIAAAAFIAPRYDLDPADPAVASHEQRKGEFFSDLKGGRDWLMQRYQETCGHSRALYLATAALGERRAVFGTDNPIASVKDDWEGTAPLRWEEADEPAVLRACWLQVREVCGAAHYTSRRVQGSPPWTGIVKNTRKKCTSLLAAPLELPR